MFCPSFFNEDETYQFYANIKAKVQLLASGAPLDDPQLKQIDAFLLKNSAPMNFDADSQENVLLRTDSTFETLCAVLESNGVADARKLTALQFYLRLEYFKKQSQQMKRPA